MIVMPHLAKHRCIFLWRYLQDVELNNLCCPDLHQVRDELRKAKARLRHKTHAIQSCIRQVGYDELFLHGSIIIDQIRIPAV